MSSRNYQVTINVKDGGVLQRLEGLQKGGGGRAKGGGPSGGGMMSSLGGQLGNLAKLAGIAISVGSIAAMTIKSSGYLQQSLKLMETTFMIVLKPFGDFVGLALRPLVLQLLMWALPFYKIAGPWFRTYGTIVGQALAKSPLDALSTLLKSLGGPTGGIGGGVVDLAPKVIILVGQIQKALDDAGLAISMALANVPQMFWGYFVSIGTSIWQTLSGLPNYFFGVLGSVGAAINDMLLGIPGYLLDVFTGLIGGISAALANVPQMIFNAIMEAIRGLAGGLLGGGYTGSGGGNATRFTRGRTTTAAVADTLN